MLVPLQKVQRSTFTEASFMGLSGVHYGYDYDYDLIWVKPQLVYPNNTNSYKNKF